MSDRNEKDLLETEVKRLLRPLKSTAPAVDPYLKTRILARIREEQSKPITFWQRFRIPALASSMAAVAVAASALWMTQGPRGEVFTAAVSKPVVVKMDLKGIDTKVAYAQVELSNGVKFYSRSFPKIEEQKSLDLDWKNREIPATLPIVVKAEEKGMRLVRVKFFDEGKHLVSERLLKIRFENGKAGEVSAVERGQA